MQETTHPAQHSVSVWKRGATYPSLGSGPCTFSFEFALPPDLPSSFDFTGMDTKAVVRYFIEVVCVRASMFRLNKKVIYPLAIIPSHPHGAELHSALQFHWDGDWSTIRRASQVRKGLWGNFANATVEVSISPLPCIVRGSDFAFLDSSRYLPSTSFRCSRKSRIPSR